jgi:hypothetical protein
VTISNSSFEDAGDTYIYEWVGGPSGVENGFQLWGGATTPVDAGLPGVIRISNTSAGKDLINIVITGNNIGNYIHGAAAAIVAESVATSGPGRAYGSVSQGVGNIIISSNSGGGNLGTAGQQVRLVRAANVRLAANGFAADNNYAVQTSCVAVSVV